MPVIHKQESNGRLMYRPAGVETEITTEQSTTSTGTQNNFSLSASQTTLRCNNASDLTITGFTIGGSAPVEGDEVVIVSIGAGHVYLAHQNASSTAANRLINTVTSGNTPLAAGSGYAIYRYDTTTDRWRLITHVQGAPITPTFDAANFTASGTMTWTLAAGDVTAYNYIIVGKLLVLTFALGTTSVGGAASTELRVAIPGGITAVSTAVLSAIRSLDNGTDTIGFCGCVAAASYVRCWRNGFTNWSAASVDNTTVQGVAIFEVT